MRSACCGFKTLVVDLDAQAHATYILGISEAEREERIGHLLRPLRDEYDVIVVDTAPYASLVTINAILAADEICTVASTEYLAVAGLQKLFRIMKDLVEQFEHSPSVRIIPNLFDVREGHAQEAPGVLRQKYGGRTQTLCP
jgi:chromosome partitioning protein